MPALQKYFCNRSSSELVDRGWLRLKSPCDQRRSQNQATSTSEPLPGEATKTSGERVGLLLVARRVGDPGCPVLSMCWINPHPSHLPHTDRVVIPCRCWGFLLCRGIMGRLLKLLSMYTRIVLFALLGVSTGDLPQLILGKQVHTELRKCRSKHRMPRNRPCPSST